MPYHTRLLLLLLGDVPCYTFAQTNTKVKPWTRILSSKPIAQPNTASLPAHMGTVNVAKPWPAPMMSRPANSMALPVAAICSTLADRMSAAAAKMNFLRPNLQGSTNKLQRIMHYDGHSSKFKPKSLAAAVSHKCCSGWGMFSVQVDAILVGACAKAAAMAICLRQAHSHICLHRRFHYACAHLSAQVAAAAVASAAVMNEQLMYICSAGELSLQ
jgi:hypothetical protein